MMHDLAWPQHTQGRIVSLPAQHPYNQFFLPAWPGCFKAMRFRFVAPPARVNPHAWIDHQGIAWTDTIESAYEANGDTARRCTPV